MSAMDSIRAGIAQALGALADSGVTYRAGTTGSWSDLASAVLTADRPVGIGYDSDEDGEVSVQTGSCSVPAGVPALSVGAQIKDNTGAVWAVVDALAGVAVTFYRLKRMHLSDYAGPNRPGGER
jgi:hypothetical protein